MKKIYLFFAILSLSISLMHESSLYIDFSRLSISNLTDQIIFVIPPNYTTSSARLYFYEKAGNEWNQRFNFTAHIGKKGLGKTVEGDMKTPVGIYQFNRYFGIEENPGTNLPYVKVNKSHYWNGDSYSDRYNQLVNDELYQNFDKSESEHLIDVYPGYEYAMNINYNKEGIKFKGCAIFMHCFTSNKYTAGCVAIDKSNIVEIYNRLNENCYIVIDTLKNMTKYYKDE